jgi:protein-S-isoprenylcysteine O-methyltransferase Ste14
MNRTKEEDMREKFTVKVIEYGAGILFLLQCLLAYLFYDWINIRAVTYVGWAVLLGGCALFILPYWDLKKRGHPGKRKAIHTTVVVDSGFYSIIRHPMYLGWILIIGGLVLMSLHMVTVVLGIPSMGLAYESMLMEEKMSLEKFGKSYTAYMNTVPRINVIKGILNRRKTAVDDSAE